MRQSPCAILTKPRYFARQDARPPTPLLVRASRRARAEIEIHPRTDLPWLDRNFAVVSAARQWRSAGLGVGLRVGALHGLCITSGPGSFASSVLTRYVLTHAVVARARPVQARRRGMRNLSAWAAEKASQPYCRAALRSHTGRPARRARAGASPRRTLYGAAARPCPALTARTPGGCRGGGR